MLMVRVYRELHDDDMMQTSNLCGRGRRKWKSELGRLTKSINGADNNDVNRFIHFHWLESLLFPLLESLMPSMADLSAKLLLSIKVR